MRGWRVAIAAAVILAAVGVGVWTAPRGGSADDPVVARVDATPIYRSDVEFQVLAVQAQSGVRYEGPAGEAVLRDLRRQALQTAIDRVLLAKEGQRRGYREQPGEVARLVEQIRRRVPEGTELSRQVRDRRFDAAIERLARLQAVGGDVVEEIRSGVRVTAAEVEQFYREHPQMFRVPASTEVEELRAASREQAAAALRRLRSGQGFLQVAQAYQGVNRVLVIEGGGDPREPYVRGARPGSIVGPVRVPEGYAVIRVVRQRPGRMLALSEVRDRIERQLRRQKEGEALARLLEGLRSRHKVEVLWKP